MNKKIIFSALTFFSALCLSAQVVSFDVVASTGVKYTVKIDTEFQLIAAISSDNSTEFTYEYHAYETGENLIGFAFKKDAAVLMRPNHDKHYFLIRNDAIFCSTEDVSNEFYLKPLDVQKYISEFNQLLTLLDNTSSEPISTNKKASESLWASTKYTKEMLKGDGAFLYDNLYYIVLSEEKKTAAVMKPQKMKYQNDTYNIPQYVRNGNVQYTVIEIAPHTFKSNNKLTKVTFPESIEAIREYSFANCKNLSQIQLPPNLRFVGECAFYNDDIEDIILPESIEELADEAFFMCKRRNLIGHTQMGRLYVPSTLMSIGKNAFSGFKNGYGFHWTAKFNIENLPQWVTYDIAKKIGIHEDSFQEYVNRNHK